MQKKHALLYKNSSASERVDVLNRFEKGLHKHEAALTQALKTDLNKHAFESSIMEFSLIFAELKAVRKELREWMRITYPGMNIANPLASNKIHVESKGVCLILSPWNYPVQLTLTPLISCLAAGNTAFVKPSEITPAVSEALKVFVEDTFLPKEVTVVLGDGAVAAELTELPFNHIFFTGSPAVGKLVMAAAAKNLTSVTLELGGKSPVVIGENYDLEDAAKKIIWGKYTNAGQTCIATDYVLLPKGKSKEFAEHLKTHYLSKYTLDGKLNSDEVVCIVSDKHFSRLTSMVEDIRNTGGEILFEGEHKPTERLFGLTVVGNVSSETKVFNEEIFGPILPLFEYETIEEAVDFIRSKDKPLALYVFSHSRSERKFITHNTWAGGVTINDVFLHLSDVRMPFGGSNFSGMGYSHGYHGFLEFCHLKSEVHVSRIFNSTSLVHPPYKGKEWLAKILRRII
ncbi:MAG: aldehyde dehydrogenase family protein [Sediminibacterium sp.]